MSDSPTDAPDLDHLDADGLVALVRDADDATIATNVRALGTQAALDRVFAEFPARFDPERAPQQADIQFIVTDDGVEHPYAVQIANGTCTTARTQLDGPRVTLRTDVATFLRLITNQTTGMAAFMSGKLAVSGDLMFAASILNFFRMPGG